MAPSPVAIVEAYGRRYDAIREHAAQAITVWWATLTGVDEADIDRFVEYAVPVVAGAQSATAELVDGYLAAYLAAITGADVGPVGLDGPSLSGAALRGGVGPDVVYRRPLVEIRRALADGSSWEQAKQRGLDRATSTAETDVALAHRAAADAGMEAHQVAGYRRVLTGRSCALCAVASTQRYRTGKLMPIHSHCDCRIAPIAGDQDPGRVINRPLLKQLKDAGVVEDITRQRQGKPAIDRSGGRVVAVEEHGELGPVLTRAGDSFTGPGDI